MKLRLVSADLLVRSFAISGWCAVELLTQGRGWFVRPGQGTAGYNPFGCRRWFGVGLLLILLTWMASAAFVPLASRTVDH